MNELINALISSHIEIKKIKNTELTGKLMEIIKMV